MDRRKEGVLEIKYAKDGHEYAMITLGNKLFKLVIDSFKAGATSPDQTAFAQKRFERVRAFTETDIIPSTAHFRLKSIAKEAGKSDLLIIQVDGGSKDQSWWIEKFKKCGLLVNKDLTEILRAQAYGWDFVFACEAK